MLPIVVLLVVEPLRLSTLALPSDISLRCGTWVDDMNDDRAAVAVHFELVEPQCSSIARGPSRPFHHSLRYAPQG